MVTDSNDYDGRKHLRSRVLIFQTSQEKHGCHCTACTYANPIFMRHFQALMPAKEARPRMHKKEAGQIVASTKVST